MHYPLPLVDTFFFTFFSFVFISLVATLNLINFKQSFLALLMLLHGSEVYEKNLAVWDLSLHVSFALQPEHIPPADMQSPHPPKKTTKSKTSSFLLTHPFQLILRLGIFFSPGAPVRALRCPICLPHYRWKDTSLDELDAILPLHPRSWLAFSTGLPCFLSLFVCCVHIE